MNPRYIGDEDEEVKESKNKKALVLERDEGFLV
jgi:hypothetical protein